MHIQFNSDTHFHSGDDLTDHVKRVVNEALHHMSDRITRVEVHISDENAGKGGKDDKRCMMEARVEGRHPTAVTHHAAQLADAIEGAAHKLKKALERSIAQQQDARPG